MGDGALVAIDGDDARAGRLEDGAVVAAGAESPVDVETAALHAEPVDRLAAEHGNVAGGFAGAHFRAPSGSCFKARTVAFASASSARKRLGSQIWNLWPRPTKVTASVMPACPLSVAVSVTRPSRSILRVSLVP